MTVNKSRRAVLTAFGNVALLSACGGSSSWSTTPISPTIPVPPLLTGPWPGSQPAALNPINPGFASQVCQQPWGAGNASWPQELFWQYVPDWKSKWVDITIASDGVEQGGAAPVMSNYSGGDNLSSSTGNGANSQLGGYKQYAAWMNQRAAGYFAKNRKGEIAYPGQGYISFGMPMLPADISNGTSSQTFGEWAGERVGKMAIELHCRGVFAADYFIGIALGTDYHPRFIGRFESWAQVKVLGKTVPERVDYIEANYKAAWLDFLATTHGSYYVSIGKTLLAGGKTPFLAGQISNDPAIARWWGNDPRIWSQYLPGKYWCFYVETQSATDRSIPPFWTSLYAIGATACRSPDVPICIMLDADCWDYWNNVLPGYHDGDTKPAIGWGYLKHTWLAAGWTHMANANGTVRRAAQAFMRSFWDAGATDASHMKAIADHIPTHPFGPAFYYSVNVERSFEVPPPQGTDTPNYYYYSIYLQRGIRTDSGNYPRQGYEGIIQGINLGYWVSDAVDLTKLAAADKPSAWVLYDSNRLPVAELAALKKIAPVYDLQNDAASALAAGPVRATGSGLNVLAFVDQNGSVIVMASNENSISTDGTLEFSNVSTGTFSCNGVLGTANKSLMIGGANTGSLPITVAANDTVVFEIPGIKWLNH